LVGALINDGTVLRLSHEQWRRRVCAEAEEALLAGYCLYQVIVGARRKPQCKAFILVKGPRDVGPDLVQVRCIDQCNGLHERCARGHVSNS